MNGHAALNRFYRLVWSQVTQTWHVVSEITKGHGKGGSAKQSVMGAIASVVLGGVSTLVYAQQAPPVTQLPTGGVVAQGAATISQTATAQAAAMAVNQSSQRAVINWNTFNVGQSASVNFNQPNAQAITLNRIADQNPSQIYGQINANGQVYLTNPNGIYFSPTAQVDVGALVATTHGISDADFMAGNMVFSRNGATGSVINEGQINAALGGYIALLAPEVRNSGVVVAQAGTVALAAGEVITLNFVGSGISSGAGNGSGSLAGLTVTPATLETLIENQQAVRAPGGLVILSAQSVASLQSGVINNTGTVEATTLSAMDGVIRLEASQAVVQTGTLRAPSIAVTTNNLIDAGTWDASASGNGAGHGGSIQVAASGSVEQTQAANWATDGPQGGNILIAAQSSVYLSGQMSANGTNTGVGGTNSNGTGGTGGDIAITAPSVGIAGATLSADGDTGGGRIRIGGGWHGNDSSLVNALDATVSASSIHANALNNGNGGTVVVWSDELTQYAGAIQAKGGANGGNGGAVEVSSHQSLTQAGTVDVTAAQGTAGSVLFDPANIQIVASVSSGTGVLSLTDSLVANRYLGASGLTELTTTVNGVTTSLNRILVRSATDSTVASNAGSFRIFDETTGALVSSLTGSGVNDKVGIYAPTSLGNGNYLMATQFWGSGSTGTAATAKGAVTWFNGTTGVSGIVSSSNSLVGSAAGDDVGSGTGAGAGAGGITLLKNNGVLTGNYVVGSVYWGSGNATNATAKGAVTWGSGTSGVSGVVSSSNSLVGSVAGDDVGYGGVAALTNGNYVVNSYWWGGNGSVGAALGAVTWGSGTAGVSGTVSSSNSLVGATAGDMVGTLVGANAGVAVTVLSNGNYAFVSPYWGGGKGAATWGNGATGTFGVVSGSNSMVGSATNDEIGVGGVVALTNGSYVVDSFDWGVGPSGSYTHAKGAVTWGNGANGTFANGTFGAVTSSNSLVGDQAGDLVGYSGITALTNGNYVVRSGYWRGGSTSTLANALGAVTWGDGVNGTTVGAVSSSNSLVGAAAGDDVGYISSNVSSVTALTNGNYVVASPYWGGGSLATAKGAVTWGDGVNGTTGVVSGSNSLVGSMAGDDVGYLTTMQSAITALSNGNYVVASPYWGGGAGTSNGLGAVTWGNGAGGTVAAVSSSNSLVGSSAGDEVGLGGITLLKNNGVLTGNYVVRSYYWGSGNGTFATAKGAVTWGDGSGGTVGVVSSSNSLVGSTAGDDVGRTSVTALTNGNYVVDSVYWGSGNGTTQTAAKGAVTWGNGTTGTVGVVSSSNSLVGGSAGDQVGSTNVTALANGNYVVDSAYWGSGNGTFASAKGAVTWGSGTSGVSGVVSAGNSLVGDQAGDDVGSGGVRELLINGNYVVRSTAWRSGNASLSMALGAVTWGSGTSGVTGVVSSSNSLVGSTAGDAIGYYVVATLTNGNYVVQSPNWNGGVSGNNLGALTLADGTTGITGAVSASNSLVGSVAQDHVGSGSVIALLDGRAAASSLWSTGGMANVGRVDILSLQSTSASSMTPTVAFSTNASGTSYLLVSDIVSLLNAGTAVTLQASNDIAVTSAVASTLNSGSSGSLTLDAGRSVSLNAGISLTNANLTIIGNEWVTAVNGVGGGVIDTNRSSGAATITQTSGSLSAGSGDVTLILRGTESGRTYQDTGAITLLSASGNNVSVQDNGTTAGSNVLLGSTTATGTLTVVSNGTLGLGTSTAGGAVVLASNGALDLGILTALSLSASSGNGNITEIGTGSVNSPAGLVTVTGNSISTLNAGTGNIILANAANSFPGGVSTTGTSVLVNSSSGSNGSGVPGASGTSIGTQNNATTTPATVAGSLSSSVGSTSTAASGSQGGTSQTAGSQNAVANLLAPSQLAGITPTQVGSLSVPQVQSISPLALSLLLPQQVAGFTPTQLGAMSNAQVASLTSAQIAALSPAQAQVLLSATQGSSLSAEQQAALQAVTSTSTSTMGAVVATTAAANSATAQVSGAGGAAAGTGSTSTVGGLSTQPPARWQAAADVPSAVVSSAVASGHEGVLPVTVVDRTGNGALGVRFAAQAQGTVELQMTDAPLQTLKPPSRLNVRYTVIETRNANNEPVTLRGAIVGDWLVIATASASARQMVRADLPRVLSSVIERLAASGNAVVLDRLKGIVVNVR